MTLTKQQLKEQIRVMVREHLNEFFGSAAISATRSGLRRSPRQGIGSSGFAKSKDSITLTDVEGVLRSVSNKDARSSSDLTNLVRLSLKVDSSDKKSIAKIYDLVEQAMTRGKYE